LDEKDATLLMLNDQNVEEKLDAEKQAIKEARDELLKPEKVD